MWYRNNFRCCDFTVLSGGLTCTLLQLPAPLQPKFKGFYRTQWKCSLQQEELLQRAFLLHQWHTQHLTATRLPLKSQWLINDDFYLSLILHNNTPSSFERISFLSATQSLKKMLDKDIRKRHMLHAWHTGPVKSTGQKHFNDRNSRTPPPMWSVSTWLTYKTISVFPCLFYCSNSKGTNLNLMKYSINLKTGKMPA